MLEKYCKTTFKWIVQDKNLIFSSMFKYFLVHNIIHDLESLDSFLLRYSDELLFEGDWSEAVVEEVQALGRVHSEEGGYVLIVRQRGTEAHQPHILLGCLYVADCPEIKSL